MKKIKKTISFLIIFLSVAYMGLFCWLNIAKVAQHADSDIASEALLAREIWEEKSLTPDNWISSTERRILSPATLGALFYGITDNMNLSMGLACILCGAVVIAGFLYLLKTAGLSWLGIITACLVLFSLPINGIQVEGQMLPYFSYLVFLFAGYYAPHIIAMLFGTAIYIRFKRGEFSPFLFVMAGITGAIVMALGASGMRCFQVVMAPLLIMEVLSLYKNTKRFTRGLKGRWWIGTCFVGFLLLCTIFGMCYPSSVNHPMFMLDAGQISSRLFGAVPAAILECLGAAGNVSLKSFGAVMQLLLYAFIGLTVYAYLFVKKHRSLVKEDTILLLDFFLYALLFTVFVVCVTTVEPYHYYFFSVVFLVAAAVGILCDLLEQRYHVLMLLVLGFVSIYALCNLQYTYLPAAGTADNQKAYEEVAAFMEEKELAYGYAQFWHANRLAAVSNGRITMGNVYQMSEPRMYWWLTNTQWYVPALPQEMLTAYLVTWEEKEGFLTGMQDRAEVQEVFSNEKFVLYTSDKNVVNRE